MELKRSFSIGSENLLSSSSIIFNRKKKMSTETVLDNLAQTYSEDLRNLKHTHIRVLRIIREYHLATGRWLRAKEIEERYGSIAVYDILEEMRRFGWVERVEIRENGRRHVIYPLTKVGETLAILSQELVERYRREAVRRLLEELRLSIESLSVLPWRRKEIENLAQVLADESVRLAQSSLYEKYARDSVIRVDDRMLFEEAKSILRKAQNDQNDNELRKRLFSSTLREYFKRFGNQEESSSREDGGLYKRLEKLLEHCFLSGCNHIAALIKLRVVRSFLSIIPSLIYYAGVFFLLSLAIAIGLTLYALYVPAFFPAIMIMLPYPLLILLLAVICVLARRRTR